MLIGEYVSEPQNPGSVFVGGSGLLKPGSRHDRSSKAIRETLPRQRYKLPVLSFARDRLGIEASARFGSRRRGRKEPLQILLKQTPVPSGENDYYRRTSRGSKSLRNILSRLRYMKGGVPLFRGKWRWKFLKRISPTRVTSYAASIVILEFKSRL